MSGQESNPKVKGYREKFNIGNVGKIFYTCCYYAISFLEKFSMLRFHRHRHPRPGHISRNEKLERKNTLKIIENERQNKSEFLFSNSSRSLNIENDF